MYSNYNVTLFPLKLRKSITMKHKDLQTKMPTSILLSAITVFAFLRPVQDVFSKSPKKFKCAFW